MQIPFSSRAHALLIVGGADALGCSAAVDVDVRTCLSQARALFQHLRPGTRLALIVYDGESYAPSGKWTYDPPRRRKGRKNVVSRKVR